MDASFRHGGLNTLAVMTLLLWGCAGSPSTSQTSVEDALGLKYPIYATLQSIDIESATKDWPAEELTGGLPISLFPLRGVRGQPFATHYVAVEVTEQNNASTISGVPPSGPDLTRRATSLPMTTGT